MQSSKRKCLSFETKLNIIEEVERGLKSKADICRENGIAQSSLSTFLKDKDKIRAAVEQGTRKNKRQRNAPYDDVDKALFIWFRQARSRDVPISGPILTEKGEELAKSLGHEEFKMSGGWLDRFKLRHGIVLKTVSGESSSSKDIDTTEWETELKSILAEFAPQDIFNADETGLFYKCLPNKSLAFQGDSCSGQKIPKERISLLCAANMDGSEKLPLLAVGKFEKPRCFKNIRTLPVTYRNNRKAWMTSALFEEWLRKLDRRFLLQGRTIALFVDNCSVHPRLPDLRAIKLFFLAPNMTSRLQPCDQGIIKNFKTIYRKRVLRRFINTFKETGSTDSHFKMSLLDALIMAAAAWDDVEQRTIQKCFSHAGFVKSHSNETSEEPVNPETSATAQRDEVSNLFEKLSALTDVRLSVDEYISIDDSAVTTEEMTVAEIASSLQPAVEENEDEDDHGLPPVSSKVAQQSMDLLRTYAMQQPNGETALRLLNKLESVFQDLTTQAKKQSKVDSFFAPQRSHLE